MAENVRASGGGPLEMLDLWQRVLSTRLQLLAGLVIGSPAIGNGTTAGRLRTTASATVNVAGRQVAKASTDDLWNLSGEAALGAGQHRAYWLLIDSAGTASFTVGSISNSVAGALLTLPDLDGTKGVLGVYSAGPNTVFTNALAAQGTIFNGIPAGASCGMGNHGRGFVANDWTILGKA